MLDVLMPLLARVLTPLFAIGMAGAGVVVAITLVRDVVEFFTDEDASVTADPSH